MSLLQALAPRLVPVLLANVTTKIPFVDQHVFRAVDTPHDAFGAHPAFGNGYDWHSSVHSHWTALQILAYYRDDSREESAQLSVLEAAVARNLEPSRLAQELTYFKGNPSYERPYGWAWAMKLATMAPNVRPLAQWIAQEAIQWMAALPMPVRYGVHANSAFALGLMYDSATDLGLADLCAAIADRAHAWFGDDREWPQQYERSGSDFLSPGLTEADLMARVMSKGAFAIWWRGFLPNLSDASAIVTPATVPAVEDGHIVHLHGLNLSRASALARISALLKQPALEAHARRLYDASVARAYEGHYSETHWLPTFAWDAAASIER